MTARDDHPSLARFVSGEIPWHSLDSWQARRLKAEAECALDDVDKLRDEVAELRQIIDDRNEDARYEDRA